MKYLLLALIVLLLIVWAWAKHCRRRGRMAARKDPPSRIQRANLAATKREALDIWCESICDDTDDCGEMFSISRIIERRWPSMAGDRPGFWYSRDRDQWLEIAALAKQPEKTE